MNKTGENYTQWNKAEPKAISHVFSNSWSVTHRVAITAYEGS